MPDDQDTTQNQDSEQNSIPASPEELTPLSHEASEGQGEPAPENTTDPELVEVPPEIVKALENDFSVKSNDIPPSDSTLTEPVSEQKTEEIQSKNNLEVETETEPLPTSSENLGEIITEKEGNPGLPSGTPADKIEVENLKAQIPVNEPLAEKPESNSSPEIEIKPESETFGNSKTESVLEIKTKNEIHKTEPEKQEIEIDQKEEMKIPKPASRPSETNSEPNLNKAKPVPVIIPAKNLSRELLVKARKAVQARRSKKLDKIMSLFLKQSKITNDEVEKFLHVSDATATRYLSQLEKEGKIRKNDKTGKKGKWVSYSRI